MPQDRLRAHHPTPQLSKEDANAIYMIPSCSAGTELPKPKSPRKFSGKWLKNMAVKAGVAKRKPEVWDDDYVPPTIEEAERELKKRSSKFRIREERLLKFGKKNERQAVPPKDEQQPAFAEEEESLMSMAVKLLQANGIDMVKTPKNNPSVQRHLHSTPTRPFTVERLWNCLPHVPAWLTYVWKLALVTYGLYILSRIVTLIEGVVGTWRGLVGIWGSVLKWIFWIK
ncbi:hypothetical protein YB2330_004108 [Saitoella coloradoensis]